MIQSLLAIAAPIVMWLLRRAGAKEEALKAFQDAVKSVQGNREDSVKPSEEEEEMMKRIREKLDGKPQS